MCVRGFGWIYVVCLTKELIWFTAIEANDESAIQHLCQYMCQSVYYVLFLVFYHTLNVNSTGYGTTYIQCCMLWMQKANWEKYVIWGDDVRAHDEWTHIIIEYYYYYHYCIYMCVCEWAYCETDRLVVKGCSCCCCCHIC